MKTVFWILLLLLAYHYVGYLLLLYAVRAFRRYKQPKAPDEGSLPEITLLVAAYNEKDVVADKVENSCSLDYPRDKLKLLWVTDGSDDGTPELLKRYKDIEVLHQPERQGKIAAMNRAMEYVQTPITVFTDANTYLGKESLPEIARLFQDGRVGCVAGEKRIISAAEAEAAASGEGLYWKYEAVLKHLEADIHSVAGAAGELFAIRSRLYQTVPHDTILDDFVISMRIAFQGFFVKYSHKIYAAEYASANIQEEMKRKVRIAAGGFQTLFRYPAFLNPIKNFWLSWIYISHKVLRWLVIPFALPVLLALNLLLAVQQAGTVYGIFAVLQAAAYLWALAGFALANKAIKQKWVFAPYYFVFMNWSTIRGFFHFIGGKASVKWERAKRSGMAQNTSPDAAKTRFNS